MATSAKLLEWPRFLEIQKILLPIRFIYKRRQSLLAKGPLGQPEKHRRYSLSVFIYGVTYSEHFTKYSNINIFGVW